MQRRPERIAVSPTVAPRQLRFDVIAVIALVAVTAFGWCLGHSIWSTADFSRPLQYLDPEYADFVATSAGVKLITEGHFRPFLWKYAPPFGAPFEADWNDSPHVEECLFALFGVLADVFGLFPGYNLGLLIGHLAAAVSFYLVARVAGCNWSWASVGALAFGIAPYLFAQSPHHITCEYMWHVPLFLLVWKWCAVEPGLSLSSREFRVAAVIAVVTGLQNPYYTNVFCQLTLLGGAVTAWRARSWNPLLAAFVVVGAAAGAFGMMNLDTWTYKMTHEGNGAALVREYKWLEIYGLKIKDLFIPPITHRLDALANFSRAHRQAAPLLDEGASYQGLVGLVSLIWLVGTAVRAMIEGRQRDVPMEAWWILWVVLMFTTGGFNAIIGAFGFTLFRGACRYSIVILAVSLLCAARTLSDMQAAAAVRVGAKSTWLWHAAAVGLCALILLDQVPRTPTVEESTTITRQVAADREFTEKMEASLPEAAMVFQMPVMEFPEVPAPGVPPYDHFRPYLYSRNLRYSFGAMKGRDREKWQPAVQAKFFEGATFDQQAGIIRVKPESARAAVDELKRIGFSAIYVNRNGFPDRGRGIEDALLELGYSKPPLRNATGDLACIILQ